MDFAHFRGGFFLAGLLGAARSASDSDGDKDEGTEDEDGP